MNFLQINWNDGVEHFTRYVGKQTDDRKNENCAGNDAHNESYERFICLLV
jgi:hypothetical protein